ncbi:hypothetical protein PUR_19730 [Paenibacillus sp. URB8-2]|nr:hypothetical protein PUR_19730 [Paenibacillus sp. URB8-2]
MIVMVVMIVIVPVIVMMVIVVVMMMVVMIMPMVVMAFVIMVLVVVMVVMMLVLGRSRQPVLTHITVHNSLPFHRFGNPIEQCFNQFRMKSEIPCKFNRDTRVQCGKLRCHFLNALNQNSRKQEVRKDEDFFRTKT